MRTCASPRCRMHLSPAELLGVYRRVYGVASPPASVLAIRGFEFELGAPISPPGLANLEAAVRFVEHQFSDADSPSHSLIVGRVGV